MNISITPELEKFVQQQVKSGMYNSASELVREALRLLAAREEIRKKRIEKLNQEIQLGLDDAAAGRVVDGEEVDRRMDALIASFEARHAEKP